MPPSTIHLPNGHTVTVSPVFGGLSFKSVELTSHHSPFPPGWTIIINSEDEQEEEDQEGSGDTLGQELGSRRKQSVHRFRKPTLRNDHLFISSISNPSSTDFRPVVSPTRQIAMMLWTTLWWYFHQPEPEAQMETPASASTAQAGRPKGHWRIYINREGIFKGRHLMQKLERMGLIANDDSSVGVNQDEATSDTWSRMFVSKRHFWQLDARLYLFAHSPAINSPFPSGSPATSRPGSPNRGAITAGQRPEGSSQPATPPLGSYQGQFGTGDPFHSSSHLPTYYPPPPAQYVFENNVRHPLRPKPPRQGETFYCRFIPSLGEYLSFRVASLSSKPVAHAGPVNSPAQPLQGGQIAARNALSMSDSAIPTMSSMSHASGSTDVELLHKWMNDPRVAYSWGEDGPIEHQQEFLQSGLKNKHSFPVIGCFDGKPFGYFEIYWVKEDRLGAYASGNVGDWDRGLHVLVGEQDFRGSHRVKVWLSALVHYCWLADSRTQTVVLEPRVDNEKLKNYCESVGFFKEREISFPHKQSNLMKIYRDAWDAPAL